MLTSNGLHQIANDIRDIKDNLVTEIALLRQSIDMLALQVKELAINLKAQDSKIPIKIVYHILAATFIGFAGGAAVKEIATYFTKVG